MIDVIWFLVSFSVVVLVLVLQRYDIFSRFTNKMAKSYLYITNFLPFVTVVTVVTVKITERDLGYPTCKMTYMSQKKLRNPSLRLSCGLLLIGTFLYVFPHFVCLL